MPASEKVVAWSSRLLPLVISAALLIPGNAWLVQEIRTFAGLITVLILPGYALARLLRLFDGFHNWLDALSLSVALTWSVGLLLWLLFFFLNVPLQVTAFLWLGATLITLAASAFVPLPDRLTKRPSRPWLFAGITLWIAGVVAMVYLYGGRVDGDAYSYMTWLRNVRVGDIRPGVNIHASWEMDYPIFKNTYAPTYLFYAMASFLARVDTQWVWTHGPAVWAPVMLAVQFSLTRQLFKRKAVGYVLVFALPLVYAGRPLFTSLGDSHHLCNFVLLPLAFWLFLRAVLPDDNAPWWALPLAALTAASLTLEHLPHIVHFLLVSGTFAAFCLVSARPHAFWRSSALVVLVLLLITPFVRHTVQLATAYGFDAAEATAGNLDMGAIGRAERFVKLAGQHLFIVRPRKLLSGQTSPWLALLGIGFIAWHLRQLWQRVPARLLFASFVTTFAIGLNPLLTPVLSRLVAPHATHRLNEALILYPTLAYGITRTGLRLRAAWRHRNRVRFGLTGVLTLFIALVGCTVATEAFEAVNMKIRRVVYSPAGVSTNLSDRLIRRVIEDELQSPPYPILQPPAQLTRYLDAPTLDYIQKEIPSDSVFLSERLSEYNLPAYADQLTYLGRLGWPEYGEICSRVREEGAEIAFPRVGRPEVYHRLEVTCAVLDADADAAHVQRLLMANSADIDYVLVTPNTAYLREKLDQVMPEAEVYDNGDFAIYAVVRPQ